MSSSDKVTTALEFANHIPDLIRSARSGSLIEYTRPTRVEPMVLVDKRVAQQPYIEDILHAGLNLFAGYYLQAVSLSVDIGNVNVMRLLDKLNPNRDPLDAVSNTSWSLTSFESNAGGLPFPDQQIPAEYTQEDLGRQAQRQAKHIEDADSLSGSDFEDAIKDINENANLSVGKLINVDVKSNGEEASFPIQVRLRTNMIRPDVLAHTLSLSAKEVSKKERWHQWRSGQIGFFKDLVLAQDMIDQHRDNLLKDASGYYRSRMDNRRKNVLSAVLSGNPSVATASAMMVMDAETAKELERKTRGKLENFKHREKIFSESYAMMFFDVDPEWEQITIYNRSIEEPTEVSVREIQRANKRNNGPDITEILNAFRQNQSPTS